MVDIVPIEYMTTGEEGRIAEVDGRPELVTRLGELGFQIGAQVHMLRSGSPCILSLNQHRLSFRGEDHATILVEVSRN